MILGIAKEMVTPCVLSKMAGYASRTETFKGIHDDLYVKACLMKNETDQTFIIGFDIIQFSHILNEKIQDYLYTKYSIKKEQVVISYSHTHAGPEVKSFKQRDNKLIYEDFLFERTKCCIDKVFLNLFDGDAYYAVSTGDWNVNRRKIVDNEVIMAPNYDAIKDRDLWMLILKDSDGDIRGIFYNYSCHPVTLSTTLFISSEYPGRINQLLEAKYYGCIAGFLQGSAGNMRPLISAKGNKFNPCSFEEVDRMALSMTAAIESVINKAAYEKIQPVLKAVSFIIPAEIEALSKEQFEQMAQTETSGMKERYKYVAEHYDEIKDVVDIHAGLVKLSNDLYLAYMGGEVCYEIKLIVQNVLKDKKLIFLGYNEAITYIPSDRIIQEGGYEGSRAQLMAGFKGPFKKGIDKTVEEYFRKNYESLK